MNTFADTEICSNTAEVAFAFNLHVVNNTDLLHYITCIFLSVTKTKRYNL